MSDIAFLRQAVANGFTQEQAAFLDSQLAKFPHTHEAEDITDFEDAVIEALPEEDEDED